MRSAAASATFRQAVLPAAAVVVLMSSIGTLYSWSIFVAPIGSRIWALARPSIVFAVATTAFTVAMLAGLDHAREITAIERIRRLSSRRWRARSLSCCRVDLARPPGLRALFGFSNGLVYGISLQVAQQATATQRGLLTGIAVSSYMLGSAVGTPLLSASVIHWNYRVTMLILAGYLAASGALAYLLLRRSQSVRAVPASCRLPRIESEYP
jgi:hypothetical protein